MRVAVLVLGVYEQQQRFVQVFAVPGMFDQEDVIRMFNEYVESLERDIAPVYRAWFTLRTELSEPFWAIVSKLATCFCDQSDI
jgi:hypothetical protein